MLNPERLKSSDNPRRSSLSQMLVQFGKVEGLQAPSSLTLRAVGC
jgi:hypothetical protein